MDDPIRIRFGDDDAADEYDLEARDALDDDVEFDHLVELIDAIGEIPTIRTELPDTRSDGTGDLVDALAEVLAALVECGAACVIVSPEEGSREFVQCIATPAGFRLEAVSNVFLWGTDCELSPQQEALLVALGWNPHDAPADPAERPEDWLEDRETSVNWWLDVEGVDAAHAVASQLLRTLVLVYSIESESRLDIEIFPADEQDWEWVDGELRPVDWE